MSDCLSLLHGGGENHNREQKNEVSATGGQFWEVLEALFKDPRNIPAEMGKYFDPVPAEEIPPFNSEASAFWDVTTQETEPGKNLVSTVRLRRPDPLFEGCHFPMNLAGDSNVVAPSKEAIKEAQRADEGTKHLIDKLENKVNMPIGPAKRRKLNQLAKKYSIENGILYRLPGHDQWGDETEANKEAVPNKVVYIPQANTTIQKQIIAYHHCSVYGCHQGGCSTESQIRKRYYCRGIQASVKKFIANCIP